MALTAGSIFEIRASATTGNVNGAGFNPANANFPTDGVIASGTGNSPTLTSATYSFAAGDVGAWVYFPTQTNIINGWYQIASVAGGVATLSAAIGQASILANNLFGTNASAGCATTGAPTGVTYGVDYSQQNTAQITATNYAAVGASTTLTSASAAFTPVMVGNIYHQTTTGTGAFGVVGWYEIVSYVNSTTVVLDRTPNNGTASVACTGFVGGAGRLNNLETTFFAATPNGAYINVKNGTYTTSLGVSAGTAATVATPIVLQGYNVMRGDTCNLSNRPIIATGTNGFTLTATTIVRNMIFTSTSANAVNGVATNPFNTFENCKVFNSSSTASRVAMLAPSGLVSIGSEYISQNGIAFSLSSTSTLARIYGNYIHDSVTGITGSGQTPTIFGNLFEACSTDAINLSVAGGIHSIISNTIYGREAKMGNGINLAVTLTSPAKVANNILYGLATGITTTTNNAINTSYYNDFFNNTADTSNWTKSATDLALDPQFVGATQLTGTTANTSGSVLTDSGANFSTVTDNVDFVRVLSGTGVTVANYLITSHTTTTLTVNNALGTASSNDVAYFVTTGHNFQIGTNLKALGFPNFINVGSETTSYPDVGAVQRQEAGGGTIGYASCG